MPARRATVSQDVAAALYAEFGSERAAARAAGLPRSTFHDVLIGRFEGRTVERTADRFARAVQDVGDAIVSAISGLVRSLGGGDVRIGSRQLAREQRRQPGVVRERAETYRRGMADVGLLPSGQPLPLPDFQPPVERPEYDRTGRRITDAQWEAYQELYGAYESGTLDADMYERFVSMQLESGSGGTGVDIADL